MALSSTFDGTENPLSESGVWDSGPGTHHADMQKISGEATGVGGNENCAIRTDSWNDIQSSEITLTEAGTTTNDGFMVAVRCQSSGAGYQLYRNGGSGGADLYWHNGSGSFGSVLASTADTVGDTAVLRLNVDDTGAGGDVFLEAFINDASTMTYTDTANNARSGVPGFGGYGTASNFTITAWEGTGEAAAGGRIMSSLAAAGGLAGTGGLAGRGGGIAGA